MSFADALLAGAVGGLQKLASNEEEEKKKQEAKIAAVAKQNYDMAMTRYKVSLEPPKYQTFDDTRDGKSGQRTVKQAFDPAAGWQEEEIGFAPNKAAPPVTRNVIMGDQEGTQQWNESSGAWDQVGQPGPRWNPRTGKGGGGDGSGAMPLPQNPNGLSGDEFLQTLDPSLRNIVQSVVDGRYPIPTGKAATSPQWQAVVQAATQVDPSFDAGNYAARAASRKDFTSGKSAAQVLSLGTLAHHLEDLSKAGDELQNRASPDWNSIANGALRRVGDPRVHKFDSSANTVSEEFAKLLKGGVPSVNEIEEQRKNLNSNMSPAQIRGVLSSIASQVQGRLSTLNEMQQSGLGLGARAQGIPTVSAHAQQVFDALQSGKPIGSDGPAPPAHQGAGSAQVPQQGPAGQETKVIGGQTFVNVNGQWFRQ